MYVVASKCTQLLIRMLLKDTVGIVTCTYRYFPGVD